MFYVVGFDVYTGKNKTDSFKTAKTLDPKCTPTTKTVVGLLQSCNLVGKGHHIYLDNYYSSPELFWNYITWKHFVVGQFTFKERIYH